jgi:hypothetical protein
MCQLVPDACQDDRRRVLDQLDELNEPPHFGNPAVTIAIFPRGNHRMLVPGTKDFVAGYLDLPEDWAAHRVAQS